MSVLTLSYIEKSMDFMVEFTQYDTESSSVAKLWQSCVSFIDMVTKQTVTKQVNCYQTGAWYFCNKLRESKMSCILHSRVPL